MSIKDELYNLQYNYDFELLNPAELKNIYGTLIGVVRNLPLRNNLKNAILFQLGVGYIALEHSYFSQCVNSLLISFNMISLLAVRGILDSQNVAGALNLISMTQENLTVLSISPAVS